MATRIKRIKQTCAFGILTPTVTLSEQPSTTGDIVTRVLIDRLTIINYNASQINTFTVSCGNLIVASGEWYNQNTVETIICSGSDSTVMYQGGAGSGGRITALAGTGVSATSTYYAWWTIPTQFYSVPGESVSITFTNGGGSSQGSIIVSLICIGEY